MKFTQHVNTHNAMLRDNNFQKYYFTLRKKKLNCSSVSKIKKSLV